LLDALDQIKATIPSPSIPKRLAGLRVLAAEDNPVNRLVLEQMLAQEGAHVAFGHDGAQALELVRTHGAAAFDIVLCDIQMPVMDGFETTLALARIAPGLSVIGLTAHAFETAKAHAREVGMVDYVTKPYMLDTLVEVILKHAKKAPSATNNLTENASSQAVPRGHTDSGLSDCQAMLSHFGSNPILLQRLVETLNETSQEILSNLTQAIESRDFNLIRTEAHSLKGAALNLHTPGLAKQATELQNLASLQAPVAFNMAKELIDNLTHFIDQIQASEKVNPTPSKP
jgi:CheY-like chemotaxis protein